MQTIDIDKVDASDTTFCISYPLEDDLLLSSIARFGFLIPVTLLRGERPIVVLGFKRVAAARRLGITQIPYVFFEGDGKRASLAAIIDNLNRPLNTIEKLRCVDRSCTAGLERAEIYEIMKMVGLPVREKTVETATAAAGLDDGAKAFLVSHRLPLSVLEQFLFFDSEERQRIVATIRPLDATVSSIREALQMMMLLKIRHGQIDFDRLGASLDMESLKKMLRRASHPLLTEMEQKLSDLLKSSALPPNIRFQVDPSFEKDSIDISLRARNSDELDHALKKLQRLLSEGILGSIFDLTHGSPIRN